MQFLRVLLFGHIYGNLALGTFNIAIFAIQIFLTIMKFLHEMFETNNNAASNAMEKEEQLPTLPG